MDNTEIYAKMSDCPEIQALPKLMGDLLWHPRYGCAICAGVLEHGHFAIMGPDGVSAIRYWHKDLDGRVWRKLPRQDDLQAMVTNMDMPFGVKFDYLTDFFDKTLCRYGRSDTTWEQLWLALVMHELYQKRWDGTAWIKEE